MRASTKTAAAAAKWISITCSLLTAEELGAKWSSDGESCSASCLWVCGSKNKSVREGGRGEPVNISCREDQSFVSERPAHRCLLRQACFNQFDLKQPVSNSALHPGWFHGLWIWLAVAENCGITQDILQHYIIQYYTTSYKSKSDIPRIPLDSDSQTKGSTSGALSVTDLQHQQIRVSFVKAPLGKREANESTPNVTTLKIKSRTLEETRFAFGAYLITLWSCISVSALWQTMFYFFSRDAEEHQLSLTSSRKFPHLWLVLKFQRSLLQWLQVQLIYHHLQLCTELQMNKTAEWCKSQVLWLVQLTGWCFRNCHTSSDHFPSWSILVTIFYLMYFNIYQL